MRRFLMLVAVAAVAGAMYAAAAIGSREASPPTAKQFAALKKQVTILNTKLKALKKDETQVKSAAVAAVEYIGACFFDTSGNIENLPVSEVGTSTFGFLVGAPGSGSTATTRSALDIDASGSAQALIQEVTPACVTTTTSAQSSARSRIMRMQPWAERSR
jgi:hypothetical protein